MYYGNDLQDNSDSGGSSDESNSFYSDTLNQILLPVTLIFVYMIALMAADLIDVGNQFKKLMEKWEKTDKNKLIIELEKQAIIEAFDKIKEDNKKELGLDLLESGNYDFNIELSDNGNIKTLEILKLAGGKTDKIKLYEYGERIRLKISTKKRREVEELELYKRVLDEVNLMDSGRGWFAYKQNETSRDAIDKENAKYLKEELISPYLDNSKKIIIDFQKQLITELGKFFNKRLDVWVEWDSNSYEKFKNVTSIIRDGTETERVQVGSLLDDIDDMITDRLKEDVAIHYFMLEDTWRLIKGD